MKINPALVLIFIWVAGTIGAGIASGMKSYSLADQSIKGVAPPQVDLSKKPGENHKPTYKKEKVVKFADEKAILMQVEDYIKAESEQAAAIGKQKSYQVTSQGVTLTILNISQNQETLEIEVKIQNKSSKNIRFLYSNLEIKDDTGRNISPITEGLPENLQPDGEEYLGVVKIPLTLLEKSRKLSLSLSNYPESTVKLKISDLVLFK